MELDLGIYHHPYQQPVQFERFVEERPREEERRRMDRSPYQQHDRFRCLPVMAAAPRRRYGFVHEEEEEEDEYEEEAMWSEHQPTKAAPKPAKNQSSFGKKHSRGRRISGSPVSERGRRNRRCERSPVSERAAPLSLVRERLPTETETMDIFDAFARLGSAAPEPDNSMFADYSFSMMPESTEVRDMFIVAAESPGMMCERSTEHVFVDKTKSLDNVILQQKASGCFDALALELLDIPESAKNARPTALPDGVDAHLAQQIWTTLLVIIGIQDKYSDKKSEWNFLVSKSLNWVKDHLGSVFDDWITAAEAVYHSHG